MVDVSHHHEQHRHNGPELSPVTPAEDARTVLINNISWGAVLAGVALALITQVLLNMVGIGVGAGVVDPNSAATTPDAGTLSIGAGIWWTISGIIAAFVGGLTAGRLSGKPDQSTAAWHGLSAWAVTTLAILYLLTTTLSSIVGGSFQLLGNVAGQAAQGATRTVGAAVSALDPLSLIEGRIRGQGDDRAAQISQAVAEVRALLTTSPQQAGPQRERAVQALARAQGIPPEQARQQIQQYEQQYRDLTTQAQQTATQAAGTASRAVSWGAILGAVALALGALAGWFGGRVGAVDPTITPLARLRTAMPRRPSSEPKPQ